MNDLRQAAQRALEGECNLWAGGLLQGYGIIYIDDDMTYEEIEMQSVLLGRPRSRLSLGSIALICLLIWFAIIWVNI